MMAMTMATISAGHADLSDLLLLVAFVLFAAAVVLEVMTSPIDSVRVAIAAGAALFALGLFVL